MFARNLPMHLVRALAQPRFAAGILITSALLTSACSDSTSRINAPLSVTSSRASAESSAPSLGTASSFAVLGGPAVTCTNTPPPTTIIGNVGVGLTAAFTNTTGCTIVGTVHPGDAVALAAYNDFKSAWNDLARPSCDEFLTGTLAGRTLTPGVYCFTAAAALTGTLTLSGSSSGTWLFKIGTGLTGALTTTNFSVLMSGSAQPCNVTWRVAEAVTLNSSKFIGTILAGYAITMTSGAAGTFNGRALAKAAVTITGGTLTGCTGGILGGGKDQDKDKEKDKDKDKDKNNDKDKDHNGSNDDRGGSNNERGGNSGKSSDRNG